MLGEIFDMGHSPICLMIAQSSLVSLVVNTYKDHLVGLPSTKVYGCCRLNMKTKTLFEMKGRTTFSIEDGSKQECGEKLFRLT